jgi:formate hydrogenlyase transcriptional activator
LRELREDIPLLVRYFTHRYARSMDKQIESIPAAAMKKLCAWHWPGNVRELENFIERSVILTQGTALPVPTGELGGGAVVPVLAGTREMERDAIIRILRETNGRVSGPKGAATRLGIKRTTLISRMKKLGINLHGVS